MSLRNTLNFIVSHPLNKKRRVRALLRFLGWQLKSRVDSRNQVVTFGEKSKIIIGKGMTGATGNYYCGLHEFGDMAFLLHFLRKGDLFVDVGANIGSYTILSSGEVGAKTISFEPAPETASILKENISINQIEEQVQIYNMALGGEKGELLFTQALDTVNHIAQQNESNTISVQVGVFDDLIEIDKPCLVKIDVEGYETEVIKGMRSALNNPILKAIIIELNGSGARYGYKDEDIHYSLVDLGFKPFSYEPFERKLTELANSSDLNTIYIRDLDYVFDRIKDSRKYVINGLSF